MSEYKLPRFRDRISKSITIDDNGCWIWQKTRSRNGYGTFAFGGGKNGRAHRVSFMAFNGPIPGGLDVCHRCDVRACVNPDHLFLGTRSENILDASRKNRVSRWHQKKGAEHPSAKLTDDDVKSILDQLCRGEAKASIARKFGVSDRSILLISRGDTWRHIERPGR